MRRHNGAVTVPMLLTEPRHHRMLAGMEEREERSLGWLDTCVPNHNVSVRVPVISQQSEPGR